MLISITDDAGVQLSLLYVSDDEAMNLSADGMENRTPHQLLDIVIRSFPCVYESKAAFDAERAADAELDAALGSLEDRALAAEAAAEAAEEAAEAAREAAEDARRWADEDARVAAEDAAGDAFTRGRESDEALLEEDLRRERAQ